MWGESDRTCPQSSSGGLNASQEDIELTEKVIRTGRELNIELLDHIIVTNDDYMSMAEYEIGGF